MSDEPNLINRTAAHQSFGEFEGVFIFAGDFSNHAHGLTDHFGADAIAREKSNVEIHECATIKPYSIESASARHEASMMFVLAPTVLQRLVLLRVSINTRVMASVP